MRALLRFANRTAEALYDNIVLFRRLFRRFLEVADFASGLIGRMTGRLPLLWTHLSTLVSNSAIVRKLVTPFDRRVLDLEATRQLAFLFELLVQQVVNGGDLVVFVLVDVTPSFVRFESKLLQMH